MNKIRSLLARKRKPMNNDEWTIFSEKLTPEQRAAVELARAHYFDDALKSYLVAFLKMLEGHEDHLSGLRVQTARFLGNQEMITEHLARQDEKFDKVVNEVGAVGSGLAALTDTFSEAIERVDDWRIEVDGWRKDIDDWRVGVDSDIASFKESRKQSMRQHEETKHHREILQVQGEETQKQLGELLELVYKLSNEVSALKDTGGGLR